MKKHRHDFLKELWTDLNFFKMPTTQSKKVDDNVKKEIGEWKKDKIQTPEQVKIQNLADGFDF